MCVISIHTRNPPPPSRIYNLKAEQPLGVWWCIRGTIRLLIGLRAGSQARRPPVRLYIELGAGWRVSLSPAAPPPITLWRTLSSSLSKHINKSLILKKVSLVRYLCGGHAGGKGYSGAAGTDRGRLSPGSSGIPAGAGSGGEVGSRRWQKDFPSRVHGKDVTECDPGCQMQCSKLEFQVNELLLHVSVSQVLRGAHSHQKWYLWFV